MNNIYPPALHWSTPKFFFGQLVRLSALPSPYMLYGHIIGIHRPLLVACWQYEILISENSSLFTSAQESVQDLILAWNEDEISPFHLPSSIQEYIANS
jgi:hypothetical protein